MEEEITLPPRLTARQSKMWLFYCHFPVSSNILREICAYLGIRRLLPCLQRTQLRLFDLETLQCRTVALSLNVTTGWTYCLLEDRDLLCINNQEEQTYELALQTGVFIPTARLPRLLEFPGMIWMDPYGYSFGGSTTKLALKYVARGEKWEKMADLHYPKSAFTPCLYEKEVYLCCPSQNNDPFEAFSPEKETFRDLPFAYRSKFYGSVTFLVNDTFYIIAYERKLLKLRPKEGQIDSIQEIDLKRDQSNAFTNISPVQMGKFIYWVNHITSCMVRFDVDTCCVELEPNRSKLN